MSAYVDGLMHRGWMLRGRCAKSSHLIADSLAELHSIAQAVGLDREWFQAHPAPHYDLTASRRKKALELGARELDRHAFVDKLRELRTGGING